MPDEGMTQEVVLEAKTLIGRPKPAELAELMAWWQSGRGHILLVTNHQASIRQIVGCATSISTALRDPQALKSVTALVAKSGRGTVGRVFPFENDEATVEVMRQLLEPAGVPVVRVIADRICREVTVQSTGVLVDTEDYYRVVIADATIDSRALFGDGNRDDRHSVVFEKDQKRFSWEFHAKRLLVNGLHFAYVVYAFRRLNALYSDRVDLLRNLVESPITELLLTQDVQDAMDQIAALYVIALLTDAEHAGLVATRVDVEREFDYLMKLRDAFGERLASMRDYMARILKPKIGTVADRVERFTRPLSKLEARLAKSPITADYYRATGLDAARAQRDAEAFSSACVGLLGYIAQGSEESRLQVSSPKVARTQ